jgi:hypothetical protein
MQTKALRNRKRIRRIFLHSLTGIYLIQRVGREILHKLTEVHLWCIIPSQSGLNRKLSKSQKTMYVSTNAYQNLKHNIMLTLCCKTKKL